MCEDSNSQSAAGLRLIDNCQREDLPPIAAQSVFTGIRMEYGCWPPFITDVCLNGHLVDECRVEIFVGDNQLKGIRFSKDEITILVRHDGQDACAIWSSKAGETKSYNVNSTKEGKWLYALLFQASAFV